MATKALYYLKLTLLLSLTPLFTLEVFAQVETSEILNEDATSTVQVIEEDTPWFRSEMITGSLGQGDFVVGPGRTEIELSPGETVIQEISITNRISDNRIFKLEVEDITGTSDASEAVKLSGNERGPYSIWDYISFPEDQFSLTLGERARIPVTISIPSNAEPGGYYGSVLVSTVQADENNNPLAARQPVVARIGSLFFLRVKGDTVISGETVEISALADNTWYEEGPIDLGILYENNGSVHVNPYGELSITSMFGEEVGYVELEPWFVLPGSLRLREVSWDREFLLGRYTATAKINRGYDDIIDEVSVTFWVLPWKIVGGTFAVVFTLLFLIRAFFRKFEFKAKDS